MLGRFLMGTWSITVLIFLQFKCVNVILVSGERGYRYTGYSRPLNLENLMFDKIENFGPTIVYAINFFSWQSIGVS